MRTADCVWQTTTTTGTGTLTLGSAVTGHRTLAEAVSDGDLTAGDVVPYRVEAVDADGEPTGAWETGEGTVGSGGTTLTRDAVRASSTGGSAVSFAAGTKYVFLTEVPDPEPVTGETPAGTVDGVNAAFTLAATPATGSLRLYKNGLLQRAGASNDYALSGLTITFTAGAVPATGDALDADYTT